jgi:diguanylate cyclase (GGDEF)-like protein/PAS domain S-box-containing protein
MGMTQQDSSGQPAGIGTDIEALQVERARLLYANLPASIIVNALLALILAGVQSSVIASGTLLVWLGLMATALLVRVALATAWRYKSRNADHQAAHWIWLFRIGVIATGAAWGAGTILLSPPGNIQHQAYTAFVLAGLGAGAVASLSIDSISTIGFLLPSLGTLVLFFLVEGGEAAIDMGGMVALFLIFTLVTASRVRRSLLENFRWRIQAVANERVLRESDEMLNQAQRIAHIGSWELDLLSDKLTWSAEIYRIFEIDPERFGASYQAFLDAIHPDDRDLVNKAYADSLVSRQPYDIEHRLLFADGRFKYVHEHCETHFDEEGRAIRSLGTVQDITNRKKDEIALRESELRLRFILENSPIATRITNAASGLVIFANQRYAALIDSLPEQVIGTNPAPYYANPQDYAEIMAELEQGKRINNRLVELLIPDGQTTRWVLASYLRLEYQGETAILGWFYDITDRKKMEEQVQHLAYHDMLTDLPNRMLFSDRLQQALVTARRDHALLALMFVDLDKFKHVNDTLGHNVGDLLLKEVARRLQKCLRESDTVARIGGDEFIVMLPQLKVEQDAWQVAEKIRGALEQEYVIAGHDLHISSSIGVAMYPEHGDEEELLIRNADTAMYYAKTDGRNNVKIYRPDMQE